MIGDCVISDNTDDVKLMRQFLNASRKWKSTEQIKDWITSKYSMDRHEGICFTVRCSFKLAYEGQDQNISIPTIQFIPDIRNPFSYWHEELNHLSVWSYVVGI